MSCRAFVVVWNRVRECEFPEVEQNVMNVLLEKWLPVVTAYSLIRVNVKDKAFKTSLFLMLCNYGKGSYY